MRVLLVAPFYEPDSAASAPLHAMLCADLVRLGCKVSVICAFPHYPTGKVAAEFRGHLIQHEVRNGVDVTRVWVPSLDRSRLSYRLCSIICYQILATVFGLYRKFDVLLTVNPAFELALPILFLGRLRRKPIVLSVWDIYPDVGIRLGVFRHRPVITVIRVFEKFAYRFASKIQVLSNGHKQVLTARGVPEAKLSVIGPWVDTDFITPLDKCNSFSIDHGLDSSFVAMYAGNFGLTHGVDRLVETARLLAHEPAIRFAFVGNGASWENVRRIFTMTGLTNSEFIPFQPRDRLPWLLATADVSLVMFRRGFGKDSVPSKCYPILASGRPIIASADRESDTGRLVQEAHCGLCVEPENPKALAEAILELYDDKERCRELGKNARQYALKYHSHNIAAREFHSILSSLTDSGQMVYQEDSANG